MINKNQWKMTTKIIETNCSRANVSKHEVGGLILFRLKISVIIFKDHARLKIILLYSSIYLYILIYVSI
jgi:hypothetical protein